MFGNFEGWLFSVVFIVVVWIYLLIRKGPVAALGASMVLSFAFPVWLKVDIGGAPIDVRTAIALINLLSFILHPRGFHPQGKILLPLTLLDCCMAMIYLSHIATDSFATGFTPMLPCLAYCEWVLPYVAGRYAIRDRTDLKWVASWVLGVLLLLGLTACFESLTKVNPFEFVFGNRPTELASRHDDDCLDAMAGLHVAIVGVTANTWTDRICRSDCTGRNSFYYFANSGNHHSDRCEPDAGTSIQSPPMAAGTVAGHSNWCARGISERSYGCG